MDMNETTARTPRIDADMRSVQAADIDDPLIRLIVRQQELIVMQSEQLAKAIGAILAEKAPVSLRGELDELFGAIAKITPEDWARAGETARMLFDTLKRSCAVGGGAIRGTS
jgi:hypothetical protein